MRNSLIGKLSFVLIFMLFTFFYPADAQSDKTKHLNDIEINNWREDIDYLYHFLLTAHKNPFHAIPGPELEKEFLTLKKNLPGIGRNKIIIEMAKIVASIGDGHTRLQLFRPQVGFSKLPINIYKFSDGFFVQSIDSLYKWALGSEVIKIGDKPVSEVYKLVCSVTSHENEFGLWDLVPKYMSIPQILHAFNIINDASLVVMEVKLKDGSIKTLEIKPTPMPSTSDFNRFDQSLNNFTTAKDMALKETPEYLKNSDALLACNYNPGTGIVYVQINQIRNDPRYGTFRTFCDSVFKLCDSLYALKLIIDLRLNHGGDASLIKPLLEGIIKRDKINKKGNLFVIIGRRTFSAAGQLTTELESNTNSILVGEPTATGRNRYGETGETNLPNSNILVSVSTQWIQRGDPDDDSRYISSEITTLLSSTDYFNNIDPAYNAIRNYIPCKSNIEIFKGAYDKDTVSLSGLKNCIDSILNNPQNKYNSLEIDLYRFAINNFYRKDTPEMAIEVLKLSTLKYHNSFLNYFTMAQVNEELKKIQKSIECYKLALSNSKSGYFKQVCSNKIQELSKAMIKN